MNKIITSLLLIGCFSFSYAQKTVINDANAQQRTIGSFSSINISGGIDLYLSQGNEEGIAVSASDRKYIADIKTDVRNGELKIWYAPQNKSWKTGNRKLKAYVSFKDISSLKASGASDVILSGAVNLDKLNIEISGASDFRGELQVKNLTVNQSGASDATISGKVTQLSVHASGASDMEAYKLESENCSARASGASDIRITVNKELTATANGASSIHYRGQAVIRDIKTSGASTVNKKG
jgi:hypothetical protein